MVKLELTYAALKVFELVMWLLLFTHLQACFWGLFSGFVDDGVSPTWIRAFSDGHEQNTGLKPEPWQVYVASLYWSAMVRPSR
jgi:hypothetical protein